MERDTVAAFTEQAYQACVKVVSAKNKPFVLHDEQKLQNCLTRFVEAYNVTTEQFFLKNQNAAAKTQ